MLYYSGMGQGEPPTFHLVFLNVFLFINVDGTCWAHGLTVVAFTTPLQVNNDDLACLPSYGKSLGSSRHTAHPPRIGRFNHLTLLFLDKLEVDATGGLRVKVGNLPAGTWPWHLILSLSPDSPFPCQVLYPQQFPFVPTKCHNPHHLNDYPPAAGKIR